MISGRRQRGGYGTWPPEHRSPGGPSRPGRARARARKGHVAARDICRVRVGSAAGVGGIRLGSAAPQYSGTALLVPDGCHLRDHRVCTRASPPHPGTQRASEGERRIHACARVCRDGGVVRQQRPSSTAWSQRARSVPVACVPRAPDHGPRLAASGVRARPSRSVEDQAQRRGHSVREPCASRASPGCRTNVVVAVDAERGSITALPCAE